MASKKPASALRARARSKPTPLEGRELNRALEHVGRKHERAPDASEPARTGRGIVGRKGGAASKRRAALYLPIELADELERRALAARQSLSECAAEALAEQWGITLEVAS